MFITKKLKSLFLAGLLTVTLIPSSFALVSSITEEDGAPEAYPWKMKFSNGTVTDNGDGTVTVNNGSGSGDSVTVDGVAVDTTAAFASSGDVDFVLADGGAGGPDAVTANINVNSVDGTHIALGSDAQGDVMYYNGTDWVRLAKGTAGQVLEMNAGATAPEWDTDDGASSPWTDSGTNTYLTTTTDDVIIGGSAADGTSKLTVTDGTSNLVTIGNQDATTTNTTLTLKGTSSANDPLHFDVNLRTDGYVSFDTQGADDTFGFNTVTGHTIVGDVDTACSSVNPKLCITGTIDPAVYSHGFVDDRIFAATTANTGHNSFDGTTTISGTANYDHYAGFQSRPTYGSSGTIGNIYAVYSEPTLNAGTTTNIATFKMQDALGAGTVTNQYGLKIDTLTRGTTNYPISIGSSDDNQNLIHVGVTGDPLLKWDETGDVFNFSKDVEVPTEVYGAGWNGSNEVATKDALYDKIETLGGGGAETNDLESVATNAGDAEIFVGTGPNAGAYITGLAACAADEKIEYVPGSPDTFTCEAIGDLVEDDITNLSHTADQVGTLTSGDLCTNNGTTVECTVNTEAELETALDALDVVTVTTDDITSANLATAVSNETGSGVVVFNQAPTISGKVDRNDVAVNDDSCVGEQGLWWYDTTDSAFEFCNANSGAPATLAIDGFDTLDNDYGDETITSTWTINDVGTGDFGETDLTIGGADYGVLLIGNGVEISDSVHESGTTLDLQDAMVFRNYNNPLDAANDPGIEFAFTEGITNDIRLAIPESASGNATAMIRSVTIAGPDPVTQTNDIVTCDYWSSFDSNIDCDTSGTGPDLFIEDDLELEGEIFLSGTNIIHFESDDASSIQLTSANATADRTITLPDEAGTVITTGASAGILPNDNILEADLKVVDTPSDEECLTYEATGGDFEWQSCGAGGGATTDGGTVTYVTSATDDFCVGGTALGASAMCVDESAEELQIGTSGSGNVDLGANTLTDAILGNLLTGWINLPVQSAKLTGTFITTGAAIDAGEGHWRLLFDTSSTEEAVWTGRLPNDYSSSLVAKIQYGMASATSGKVDPEVKIMCVTDGDSADINTASFDTLNEITGGTTVPGTASYLDEISISLANDDSCAAGDLYAIHLQRDHDDADDTATGDMEVYAVQIEYTR